MPQLVALSLSIAVLGGIWAFIALKVGLLVWAGFIAWGCFFHSGGDQKALIKTICGNVYGVIVAWIALLIIFKAGVGDMGLIAICIVVAVTVFFLVIVASIDQLSVVPANVYGYAATVAWSLSAPSAGGRDAGRRRHRAAAEPGVAESRQPAGCADRLHGHRSDRRLHLRTGCGRHRQEGRRLTA